MNDRPFLKSVLIACAVCLTLGATAQFSGKKRFVAPKYNHFCSGQIVFDSLGYFFKEHGCEGESQTSSGTYRIQGNRIKLIYQPLSLIQWLNRIVYRQAGLSDSTVHVRFFDRYNQLIRTPMITFTSHKGSEDVFYLRYDGGLRLPHKDGVLIFDKLTEYYQVSLKDTLFQIPLKNISMDIYLNLPGYYLFYRRMPEPKEEQITEMLFINRRLYTGDAKIQLYTLEP